MQNQNQIETANRHMSGHSFTREQIDLIKKTVAKDATDDELKLFLYTAEKRRLDPLVKQIYFQKRHTKRGPVMTMLTAIDGYRLIADRTGLYAGNDDPVFDNEDSPARASVTIYKIVGGLRCPFTATARMGQYYPGDEQGFMWRKMPHLMLGKCAEALALRKAFPEELGGLYIDEEMQQAGPPIASPEPVAITPKVADLDIYDGETPALKAQLFAVAKKLGISKVQDLKNLSKACIGLEMVAIEAAAKDWLEDTKPKELA